MASKPATASRSDFEQTKTQLWRIVNTFIDAKQNGQVPFVEVALYEYGNDGLNSETYWIRRIAPLTRDLDLVSKELFSLRTNPLAGSLRCAFPTSFRHSNRLDVDCLGALATWSNFVLDRLALGEGCAADDV